jgi:hypothetical protein
LWFISSGVFFLALPLALCCHSAFWLLFRCGYLLVFLFTWLIFRVFVVLALFGLILRLGSLFYALFWLVVFTLGFFLLIWLLCFLFWACSFGSFLALCSLSLLVI